jgi:hypothetical protein
MNPKRSKKTKDEWLTPPKIIQALGEFDLDPCSPINRPWPTAQHHFTILDNGLLKEWFGRVWLNPPYGDKMIHWMNKMSLHGNGIAMTLARTETVAFQNFVFPFADSILFIKGRITFLNVDGTPGDYNGGAPSILIGYGEYNSDILAECGISGKHVLINRIGISVIGYDKTWKLIVKTVFLNLNRPAPLDELYEAVEKMAPEKVERNQHFKAKIRQVVQHHFNRVRKGVYSI